MADLNKVLTYYQQAGWLTVPGLYDSEGKDNHCKICNWYNDHAGDRACQGCGYTKMKAGKEKKEICGVAVSSLTLEEWQVFQIIAKQILRGESPYITVEEFAKVCKKRIEGAAMQKTEQQKIDEMLYR